MGAQSSAARVITCPAAINDSQRRTTEYEGPLASLEMAGTV